MRPTDLVRDRFVASRYQGVFKVKHSRTGTVGFGVSISEAVDQIIDALIDEADTIIGGR